MDKLVISLQETINFLPDGVLIVRDQRCIELANTQAAKLFGYTLDELMGLELAQLIPARYHHQHAHHVTKFFHHPTMRPMGAGRPMFGLRKDGTEFDVDIALSPVVLNGAQLVVAVVRDATERKTLERTMQWKNQQLEAINVELERFGFTISHDLKSPLANLHAIIHLITRELPPEKKAELREHIQQLNHTLYAMSDLIAGVAAYSKATLSDAEEATVDMNRVMDEVRHLVLLPSHIRLEIAADLPPAWGNKTKLLQVLLNLVSNAIKYNDKEVGLVRISSPPNADGVCYVVEDNGPGIAPALRSKVFTLFEKGTSTRADSQGIGLAIAHKVVQALGGRITIEDGTLGGARFVLVLPSVSQAAAQMAAQALAQTAAQVLAVL